MKLTFLNKKSISHILLAICLSVTSISSSAQALDETFYSGNDILYYDPSGTCTAIGTSFGGCGSEFNIATFNILYSTGSSSDWQARLNHTSDVIKNKEGGLDVVGLQEVRENQWRALQTSDHLGDAYDIYPKPYSKEGYAGQNPVVWKKDRFELVEGSSLPGYTVLAKKDSSVSIQVKLRDRASGQEFYVINGHHPAGNGFDRQRTEMVKALYDHAKSINSDTTPVFMMADFNTKLMPVDQGAGTRREDLAYCVLTQQPFWHVYDARDNKTGHCPSTEFSLDGGRVPMPVDHIFMSRTVDASKVSRVAGGKGSNGSDVHDTIIARVKIQGDCAGSGSSGTGGAKGTINVAHGNIKNRPHLVPRLVKNSPDFVSLNESGNNSIRELEVPGYQGYRDDSFFKDGAATAQAKSTSVLWKKDKWSRVDAGREIILPSGPQKWDSGRAITWVVLKDKDGGTASMVSLHHMINPNKYGNEAVRTRLYGEAMDRVVNKMRELSSLGPVILAGDFNYQVSDDDSYGPRKKLSAVNMESTFESLGRLQGVYIDYIFYTKNMKAEKHSVMPIPESGSDHPFIFGTFTADGTGSGALGDPNTANCTCTDPNAGSSDNLAAPGASNVSKNFSLGNENGKRPVNLLKQLMVDFNFKDFQAAGIVGNFMHESGGAHLPPNVNEGGDAGPPKFSGGYGWAQWTGGRQTAFIDFAVANGFMASRNVSATDAANYAYLVHELTATAEKGAVAAVKSTQNVSEAAAKFEEVFERAGVVANESRDAHARDVLAAYKNNTGVGAPGSTNGGGGGGSCPESSGATGESPEFGEVAFPLKGNKSVVKNPESAFAPATHPYKANDIYANAGTEVLAYASGTVTSLHDGELGKGVSVWNDKAKLVVYYTHMANVSVREGAKISPGDKLGTLASVNTYPGINVDHLHIDASTDRVRQACSRSGCSILDHFRELGPSLQSLYKKLPE